MAGAPEPGLDPADRGGFEQRVEQPDVDRVAPGGRVAAGLVPLVEEGLGELEDQVGGERRGDLAVAGDDPDRRRPAMASRNDRRPGQVEVVDQAFAIGLDHDREVGHLADDLEQVLGPEPLEPERGPLRGVGPGHQQGPAGVLAEPEPEQGAVAQLGPDQLLGERRRSGRRRGRAAGRRSGAGGSGGRRRRGGRRRVIPSRCRSRPWRASLRARWSLPPNGESTARPTSPAGSRKVSTRTVRSSGTAPATRTWRATWSRRVFAAAGSSRHSARSQSRTPGSSRRPAISRQRAPTFSPSSAVRDDPLAPPEGHHRGLARRPWRRPPCAASIASIFQVEEPRTNVSPTRRSRTNSSSSSPSLGPPSPR